MKKGIDTWPDPAPDLTELHEMSLEIVLVSSKAGSSVGFVCRLFNKWRGGSLLSSVGFPLPFKESLNAAGFDCVFR